MAILFTAADLPVTLRASRAKNAQLFFACLLFCAMGAFLLSEGRRGVMPWLCMGFFGLGAVGAMLQILPNAAYLRLTREGFVYAQAFQKTEVRWEEVRSFSVEEERGRTTIAWNSEDPNKGGHFGLYGQASDDLAETMNALRATVE